MASNNVKTATDQNFESDVIGGGAPALVDFWAEWCGPCKALGPVIDELANDFDGKVNVFKLNVDDNPETAARYGVRGIPTVILIKNGEVVGQQVGVVPKATFTAMINENLG